MHLVKHFVTALLIVHGSAFAHAETEKPEKAASPPDGTSGKKVLWDRLETPDLPKTNPQPQASEAAKGSGAATDKERIEKLEEEIEGLKKRLTSVEGKVAIQGQQARDRNP